MADGRRERNQSGRPDRAFSLMSVLAEIGRLSTKGYTVPSALLSEGPRGPPRGRLVTCWREWEIGRFALAVLVLLHCCV